MKQRVRIGAWLGILMLSAQLGIAQQDFSEVEIRATPVNGAVHMLRANPAAGNIGVSVGADGLLIVDDQFAPLADKIQAALTGLADGPLRFILNTHWHGDHTGGNATFGQQAPIIAHTNVRQRIAAEQSLEQITQAGFPDEWKDWQAGMVSAERWIAIIHRSLTRQ